MHLNQRMTINNHNHDKRDGQLVSYLIVDVHKRQLVYSSFGWPFFIYKDSQESLHTAACVLI